jgi:hypothetical protein
MLMKPCFRLRYRLSTLVIVVLMAGLALGLARSWERWTVERPSESVRIVSDILAMRDARKNFNRTSGGDPTLMGGFVAVVFLGSALRRNFRRPIAPTS